MDEAAARQYQETSRMFKIILLGDTQTGKTSFARAFHVGYAERTFEMWCSCEITTLSFKKDDEIIHYKLWDSAIPENPANLRDEFYKNADLVLLFFNVESRNSFRRLPKWRRALRHKLPGTAAVLVGNKIDTQSRKVSAMQAFAVHHKKLPYIEVSAKLGVGVREALRLANEILLSDPSEELAKEIKVHAEKMLFRDQSLLLARSLYERARACQNPGDHCEEV